MEGNWWEHSFQVSDLETNNRETRRKIYPMKGEALSERSRSLLYAIFSEQLSSEDEKVQVFGQRNNMR